MSEPDGSSFGDGSSGEHPSSSPEDLPSNDPESVARIICLRLLDQRARTRAELALALTKKGVPSDAANAVLDRFTSVGLIDDTAFAAGFAAARHQQRRLAPRAITAQLRRRGVSDEDIALAVAEIDGASERRAARQLVDAKLTRFDGRDPAGTTRRLVAMLGRRGYSSGVALTTVREALSERGADPDGFEPET